jgi:hypothetical protein
MDEFTDQPPPAARLPAERNRRKFTAPKPRVDKAPSRHDQDFFLGLAHYGMDHWNGWPARRLRHRADAHIRVTFANVDFRATENRRRFSGFIFGKEANLSGATFGDGTDLSGAKFGDGADLSGATFGNGADLSGATFGDGAKFIGAAFGNGADLSGAKFGNGADLYGATFGDGAKFIGATFGDRTDLSGAKFGDGADFSGATFGNGTDLSSATFRDGAKFIGAAFGNGADLSGATFGGGAKFIGATFGDGVNFKGWSSDEWTEWRTELLKGPLSVVWQEDQKQAILQWERNGLQSHGSGVARPDRFSLISFARARFLGAADFSGRQFGEGADFSAARFDEPPRFDSMVNIDFYGAKIGFRSSVSGWTTRSAVAGRLRNLRKLADDSKNHDLERDLYIEERKAERGIYFVGHLSDAWRNVRQRWQEVTNLRGRVVFALFVCARDSC